MTDSLPTTPQTLGVTYEPLAALLFYFAESEYFRFGQEGDNTLAPSFLNAQRSFKKAWEVQLQQGGVTDCMKQGPLWLHAFGHSDSVALVLLDEIEFLPSLTLINGPRIEQVSVAFCPAVKSLGISDKIRSGSDEGRESPFALGWRQLFQESTKPRSDYDPQYLVETERPVALVTKFKVNGPVTLEHGALFQRAIFRAAARKIFQTRRLLKKVADKRARQKTDPDRIATYFEAKDVDSYRCFFLDVQGSEDFALLSFGSNLSVAASFVVALRCLTFSDIVPSASSPPDPDIPFDTGDAVFRKLLEENSEGFQHHWKHLWEQHGDKRPEERVQSADDRKGTSQLSRPTLDVIADNHVFSFVYSTPGISTSALLDPAQLTGWAEVNRLLDFSPGHGKDLLPLYTPGESTWFVSAPADGVELDREGVEWYTIGRHDLIVHPSVRPGEGNDYMVSFTSQPVRPIRLQDYIRYWRTHFDRLHRRMLEKVQSAGNTCYETGLLDQSTSLTVPIPAEELLSDVGPNHVAHLVLLNHVRQKIVDALPRSAEGFNAWNGEPFCKPEWKSHRFDVETLDACARQLGFPWPFRTRFRQLYTNFLNSFSDTVLFASILDLYDSLHALYYLIVVDYTEAQAERSRQMQAPAGACSSVLTDEEMRKVDIFLNALEDAFSHRIARSLPNHENRELTPALRGALTKMVSASDAVLKCGFGLVRRLLHPNEGSERRYLVGGAARMNFHTRAYLNTPIRGLRQPQQTREKVLLARIDMNISHIFCPEELPQYFHETSHIVYQVRGEAIRILSEDISEVKRALFRDRLEEIFAELLTHFFIFRDKTDLSAKFFVAQYNERRAGPERRTIITRFLEFMLRGFVVKLLIDSHVDRSSAYFAWRDATIEGSVFPPHDLASTEKNYLQYVETYGPFFSEFQRLWVEAPERQREEVRDYARKAFYMEFPRLWEFLPFVWNAALGVYREYVEAEKPDDGIRRLDKNATGLFDEYVDATLANGQPWLRRDPSLLADFPGAAPRYLAPLTFVCNLIYVYLRRYYGPLQSSDVLHVSQFLSSGSPPEVIWLIDPTQPGLLCLSETARQERLQYRIAFLKSLWDLSTEFRARRLCDIIRTVCPSRMSSAAHAPSA